MADSNGDGDGQRRWQLQWLAVTETAMGNGKGDGDGKGDGWRWRNRDGSGNGWRQPQRQWLTAMAMGMDDGNGNGDRVNNDDGDGNSDCNGVDHGKGNDDKGRVASSCAGDVQHYGKGNTLPPPPWTQRKVHSTVLRHGGDTAKSVSSLSRGRVSDSSPWILFMLITYNNCSVYWTTLCLPLHIIQALKNPVSPYALPPPLLQEPRQLIDDLSRLLLHCLSRWA